MWICRNAIQHQDSSMLILSLIPWMKHWLHFTVTNKVQPNAQDSTDCRLVVVVGKSNTFQLLIWGQDVIHAVEQWCIYWWCTVHHLSLVFSVHLTVLQSDKQLQSPDLPLTSSFFLVMYEGCAVCLQSCHLISGCIYEVGTHQEMLKRYEMPPRHVAGCSLSKKWISCWVLLGLVQWHCDGLGPTTVSIKLITEV